LSDFWLDRPGPEDGIRVFGRAGIVGLRKIIDESAVDQTLTAARRVFERSRDAFRDRLYLYNESRRATSVAELDDADQGRLSFLRVVFSTIIFDILSHFLGNNFLCAVEHSRLRLQYGNRQRPDQHLPHGWHSDSGVGYGPGLMATVWVPLNACGITSPGLEVVPGSNAPSDGEGTTTEVIQNTYGKNGIHAVIADPGDVVILSSRLLHRTQQNEDLLDDRYSIDLRVVDPEGEYQSMAGTTFVLAKHFRS